MTLKDIRNKFRNDPEFPVYVFIGSIGVIIIYVIFMAAYTLNVTYPRHAAREARRDVSFSEQQYLQVPTPLDDYESARLEILGIDPSTYISLADIQAPGVYCLYNAGKLEQFYLLDNPYVVRIHNLPSKVDGRYMAIMTSPHDDNLTYLDDLGVSPYKDGTYSPQARLFEGACPQ